MIRVLHVLDELRSSGAEVQLLVASGEWERFGIESEILATAPRIGAFAPDLVSAGYRVHHLPFTADAQFLRRYGSLIRAGSYDVVHVQLERASFYFAAAARAVGAGVVRTLHSAYPFEGNLARRRRLQRRVARALGTRFVAISETVAQNELQRFANPTSTISNWVDAAKFRPPSADERSAARRSLGLGEETTVVVTVGNCSQVKNHAALLQGLHRLEGVEWTWLHIGDEGEDCSEWRLAESLGIAGGCRFLGRTDPHEALHAGDLYVMPSLYEGLGMATIEAMCTGLPVLLTDVPGNRDLRDVVGSTTWCTSDARGLHLGLEQALKELGPRSDDEIRQARHDDVARRFSAEKGIESYSRLYHRLA